MGEVRRSLAALASVSGVVCFLFAVPSSAAAGCSFLDFESSGFHSLSRLVRVELPSGARSEVGRLEYQVQAAGYSRSQDLVYGIATRDHDGWLLRKPVLVSMTRSGVVTDLGPIRTGVGGLADPIAGAVVGGRFYVRDHLRLYTVDLTQRKVVQSVHLSVLGLEVEDFGADPSSGVLYGISTWGHVAKLVTVSPASGSVHEIAQVPGIPWQDGYSSVVVTPTAVYAAHTGHVRQSELYRIGYDGSSSKLAAWPAVANSDAAGCLTETTPPPPTPHPTPRPTPKPSPKPRPTTHPKPTPPPKPTPSPTHSTKPTPTPTPAPTPSPTPTAPAVLPPPRTPPPSKPTPTPAPTPHPTPTKVTPPTDFAIARPAAAAPRAQDRTVQVLRRWSLATLLVMLSGGAAMAAQRRMRARR
ncbi:hypothetical protein AB0E69_25825 [Kribbella sp. NPDC026611]|uniref:DUF6923 family protein n=1 Tax=Kribbella sp. NPDC026611 TaxID=3154911 RepID=UPI0033D3F1A9